MMHSLHRPAVEFQVPMFIEGEDDDDGDEEVELGVVHEERKMAGDLRMRFSETSGDFENGNNFPG